MLPLGFVLVVLLAVGLLFRFSIRDWIVDMRDASEAANVGPG
jgi:hypothetical protein